MDFKEMLLWLAGAFAAVLPIILIAFFK